LDDSWPALEKQDPDPRPLAPYYARRVGMIIERGLQQTHDTARVPVAATLDAQTKEYVLNGPLLDRRSCAGRIGDHLDCRTSCSAGRRLPLGYVFRQRTPVIEDAIACAQRAPRRQARAFVEYVAASPPAGRDREATLTARLDVPWTRCRRGRESGA